MIGPISGRFLLWVLVVSSYGEGRRTFCVVSRNKLELRMVYNFFGLLCVLFLSTCLCLCVCVVFVGHFYCFSYKKFNINRRNFL